MSKVIFQNPGLIPLEAITTLGISSKESENPFGEFGTGLKYAIAIILRNGGKISIFRGKEEFKFSVVEKQVRVNTFGIIHMNETPLGFTTRLGKGWEMWQAFREIYANMLDEGGESWIQHTSGAATSIAEDKTTIVVSSCDAFTNCFENRHETFLQSKPIYRNDYIEIHLGASFNVFYRGVKAAQTEKACRYTYNILEKVALTEDRTLKYSWDAANVIRNGIFWCEDLAILGNLIEHKSEFFESTLNFNNYSTLPETLKNAITIAKAQKKLINPSLIKLAKEVLLNTMEEYEELKLTTVQEQALAKAITFCETIGFPVKDYPIICVESLGDNVLGKAAKETIFISALSFSHGVKNLAGTLIEEYIHLKHDVADATLRMQDVLLNKIVDLGETIYGEPL